MDDSLSTPARMRIVPPEEAPLPDRFTMEHWLFLHGAGKIESVPYRLAPFPALVHDPLDLEEQLIVWEILDPQTREVLPDARQLFRDLTMDYSAAVFGIITFPNRAFDRQFDFPQVAMEAWGMQDKVRIVPKVPFLITISEENSRTCAVSTPDALSINTSVYDRGLSLGRNIAAEVVHLLDPRGDWPPRRMTDITVPKEVTDALVADPVLGRVDGPRDDESITEAILRVSKATGAPRSTLRTLADLTKAPITAQLTMAAVRVTGVGENVSRASATSVVLMGDEQGGRVVVGPERDRTNSLSISYRSGTDGSIGHHVDRLFEEADNADETLPESLQNAWQSPLTH